MTPQQLRNILLTDSDDLKVLNEIPESARGIKIGYRLSDHEARIHQHLRIRQFALVLVLIGILIADRHNPIVHFLFFYLVVYEVVYGPAARVRDELIMAQAKERRRIAVDEYLVKQYPGYRPPHDAHLLFSINPTHSDA